MPSKREEEEVERPLTTQDQGPYTGQSLEIPEAPYDPVGDMDPEDVAEQLAANQLEKDDEDEDEA